MNWSLISEAGWEKTGRQKVKGRHHMVESGGMVCRNNSERAGEEKLSASPEASGKAQVKESVGVPALPLASLGALSHPLSPGFPVICCLHAVRACPFLSP